MTARAPRSSAFDAALSDTGKGMLVMVAGVMMLAGQAAIAKLLRDDYHAGEILFYRGFWALLPVAWLVWRAGGTKVLRPRRPGATGVRSIVNLCSTAVLITAVGFLPLATVLALAFSSPLLVAAFSGPCLGERVRWQCWSAIALGFGGVLLITNPFGENVDLWIFLPLAGTFLLAGRDLITRWEGGDEEATTMAFWTVVASIAGGGLSLLFFGASFPSGSDWVLFAGSGILVGLGRFLVIRALRLAEASVVAPLKYLALVWGALIGYLVWGDVPSTLDFVGAAIVIASGVYLALQRNGHG